jgi:hypothetical protein
MDRINILLGYIWIGYFAGDLEFKKKMEDIYAGIT